LKVEIADSWVCQHAPDYFLEHLPLDHIGVGETDTARISRRFIDDHTPHAATRKLFVGAMPQRLKLLSRKCMKLEVHNQTAFGFQTAYEATALPLA
jgi:hypothetical protein